MSRIRTAENKGKREGKLQGKLETARIALENGIDLQSIILITGLNIDEIEKLK